VSWPYRLRLFPRGIPLSRPEEASRRPQPAATGGRPPPRRPTAVGYAGREEPEFIARRLLARASRATSRAVYFVRRLRRTAGV